MKPHAREEKLLVREVGAELVVYDQQRHRAHRLNPTAALVWRHCDGRTTPGELAALLRVKLGLPVDEDMVWLALDRLGKAHLLRERLRRPREAGEISRRQLIRRLGKAAAVALIPVVTTLAAPTPAMAGTAFLNFRATLDQAQEVPPSGSAATGTASYMFNAALTSMAWSLTVTGPFTGTSITGHHIHLAPPGVNGLIVVPYPNPPVGGGTISGTTTAADLTGPLAGMPLSTLQRAMGTGQTYVNVHTNTFPGGEIRGNIVAA